MRKHIVIAVIVGLAVSSLVFGFARSRSGSPQNKSPSAPIRSLREKAKLRGNYTIVAQSNAPRQYEEMATLVHDSAAIITGTVANKAAQMLSPAEDFIVTDYQITVKDRIKGQVRPGETITLRLPGGRIQFDDGTSAEVNIRNFSRSPEVGKIYTFFLRKKSDANFSLVGGQQGLFEISKARIEPQAQTEDKLAKTYQNMSLESFLKEIRQVNVK
jgi:hypothetical protein